MVQYEKRVLNALLDSYENSLLFTGENKVKISIDFPFTKKKMPEYFDESSYEYEKIHISMKELEKKGFLEIIWKKGKENHIISKVILKIENLEQIYAYTKRASKSDLIVKNLKLLREYQKKYDTPVCLELSEYLIERIEKNQSVKEYIDLAKGKETEMLFKGIFAVEANKRQYYIREFSIEVFHDTKVFEQIIGKVVKALRNFSDGFEEKETSEVLAEYGIYHTPNYVYFKGDIRLMVCQEEYNIGSLKQGIGISGEDLSAVRFLDMAAVHQVITIENLTTFFRWKEPESLIIYLGGYHNAVRRELLKSVYEALPGAKYYHFGDIDAGGFEIYRDLCEKTRIPFNMYRMNLAILQKYQKYGKPLKENDRVRLNKMLNGPLGKMEGFCEMVQYMLENNVKLEQECILQKDT